MTINKAYLGALRATVTLTYIPVLTPGLYDTFPGSPETFPGHIGSFPGRFWMEILIFYLHTIEPIYGKISLFASKEVQEMNHYTQETCQEVQETCEGFKGTCT